MHAAAVVQCHQWIGTDTVKLIKQSKMQPSATQQSCKLARSASCSMGGRGVLYSCRPQPLSTCLGCAQISHSCSHRANRNIFWRMRTSTIICSTYWCGLSEMPCSPCQGHAKLCCKSLQCSRSERYLKRLCSGSRLWLNTHCTCHTSSGVFNFSTGTARALASYRMF